MNMSETVDRGASGCPAEDLTPGDLLRAASYFHRALVAGVGADWTALAGSLDWDIRSTVEHVAGTMTWYAASLASRTTSALGLQVRARPIADNARVLAMVPATAQLLSTVAAAAPAGARGHHLAGMADPVGFLAMGCNETLVHGWDVACGLGLSYDPPRDLAAKVVRRLFPWAPTDTDEWTTLRWANGRAGIAGHDDVGPNWGWHCAPLAEWDGTVPRDMFLGLSFTWNPEKQRWIPQADPADRHFLPPT